VKPAAAPATATKPPETSFGPDQHLDVLDALRGIASLLVLGYHMHAIASIYRLESPAGVWVDPLSALFRGGHTGVTLFFILSAFLLSLPMFAREKQHDAGAIARFFQRRALRILPLYWFAVGLAALAAADQWQDLGRGLPYLAFLNGVGLGESIMPYGAVWWSLATEMQFYLLLPLLPFALGSRRGRIVGAVLLVLYAVLYLAFVTGSLRPPSVRAVTKISHSVFGRGPAFLMGIGVGWIYCRFGAEIRSTLAANRWLRAGAADLLLAAVLVILGMTLREVVWIGYRAAEYTTPNHAWHVLEAVLWSAVLFLVLFAPLKVAVLLRHRSLVWVGLVSYSTYIWHYPLIYGLLWIAKPWLGRIPLGWNASTILLAAAIATIVLWISGQSYRLIERPFLLRKQSLGS